MDLEVWRRGCRGEWSRRIQRWRRGCERDAEDLEEME